MQKPFQILIVGLGAVGSAVASLLDQDERFCLSRFDLQGSRSGRRNMVSKAAPGHSQCAESFEIPRMMPGASLDAVIVAVKAYQLAGCLEQLLPHLDSFTPIIITCNGAIDGLLKQELMDQRYLIRRGVVSFGVRQVGRATYEWSSGAGLLQWGPWVGSEPNSKKSPDVKSTKSVGPLPVELAMARATDNRLLFNLDARELVRSKWLFNTVLNSLCGFYRLATNGAALDYPAELKLGFDEAYRLGETLEGPWFKSKEQLWQDLLGLIDDTKPNENSMARDVRLGRQTESAFLCGLAAADPQQYPTLWHWHDRLGQFSDHQHKENV